MKTFTTSLKLVAVMALLISFTGCESTGGGGGSVSGGVYYGVSMYDPWYYGGYYYDDPDIIVTPPDRPDRPVHPEQPIARPPSSNVLPSPMPTIPSVPRPMPRARGR